MSGHDELATVESSPRLGGGSDAEERDHIVAAARALGQLGMSPNRFGSCGPVS
jgi:hypothetical protein